MSSWINPCVNVAQRNWQPAVLPGDGHSARWPAREIENKNKGAATKDPPPSAAFEIWREQQVMHPNSFTREFQTRKLMRQFLSKTHTLGTAGPPTMVLSHRFHVDVVSTDARFLAGFTLAHGHSVRLLAPDRARWDKDVCSSSLALSEDGRSMLAMPN
jgi:hypothetical protein